MFCWRATQNNIMCFCALVVQLCACVQDDCMKAMLVWDLNTHKCSLTRWERETESASSQTVTSSFVVFECTELHNKHGTGIHIQHIITRKRVGSREITRAKRPAVRRPFGRPANERPQARALAPKSQSLISGQPHEMHTHRKVFAEHAARCTREVQLSETLTYRVLAPNVAAVNVGTTENTAVRKLSGGRGDKDAQIVVANGSVVHKTRLMLRRIYSYYSIHSPLY